MINQNEAGLICDFAETYHIFDYKALPPTRAAVLAVGLREDSRIKRYFNGIDANKTELILAGIADRLSMIYCALTGSEAIHQMMTDVLIGNEQEQKKEEVMVFDSIEDFEAERKRILEERKG